MSNKIKLVILFVLLAVCCVELFLLRETNKKIDELAEAKKEASAVVEEITGPIVAPMLTINSEINKALDIYSYRNSIIDRAVSAAHELVNSQVEKGISLTDATVSDIIHMDFQQDETPDKLDMFNVELLLTTNDGEKITDNSMYLIFYTRWDVNGTGTNFVTSISEDTINKKYADVTDDYNGDKYLAACSIEKLLYLKQGDVITDESLEASASEMANAFSQSIGVSDIIFDKYTVSINGSNKMFSFGNAVDETVITVTYTYFEDIAGWVFLYADV